MKKNKEIAKLHYITTDHPEISHSEQAIRAYLAGCKWVQLRMKDVTDELVMEEVQRIVPVAKAYNGILLINDRTHIVMKSGAHGVHLGKNDMCPSEARKILGPELIIGGTANTLADTILLIEKGVDYVGLGPFRFTTTKKKLSPIIGIEGYEQILGELKKSNLQVPVIAIGGIVESDLDSLKQAGLHGVALAGAIIARNEIEINIKNINHIIHS